MTLTNMGALLEAQSRFDEAESRYRTALVQQRAVLGDDHPETLLTLGNLGGLLVQKSEYSEAETVIRESLEMHTRVFGSEHPSTLSQAAWMGELLQRMGRLEEAEQVVRSTMETIRRIHGNEHPRTLSMMNNLAGVLTRQNKLTAAEDLYRELLPYLRTVLGSEHPHLATAMGNLAVVVMKRGDYSAAEPLLRQQLEVRRRVLAPGHTSTFRTMSDLGAVLTARTRFVEAESLLLGCHEGLQSALGSDNELTLTALDRLIELYESWSESEPDGAYKTKAAKWRAKLPAPERATSLIKLCRGLLEAGLLAEAEEALRECLRIRQDVLAEGHWMVFNTMSVLGEALVGQERFAEAEPLLIEGYEQMKPPAVHLNRKHEALERIVALYRA